MKKFFLYLILCVTTSITATDNTVDTNINSSITETDNVKNIVEKNELGTSSKNSTQQPSDLYVIDSIKVKLFTSEGESIITGSDLLKAGLSGEPRTVDTIILEQLIFSDAKKHKINPSDEAIDKRFAMIRKDNNLTMDQFKEVFASAGYTLKEGYEQFKVMDAINTMLDFKIRSNLIPSKSKVEKYYEENPEMTTERYQLQSACISYGPDKQNQLNAIKHNILTGNYEDFEWSQPFWIDKADVAQDKSFIFAMEVNEVYGPLKGATGFELYRLTNKETSHLRSLHERRLDIINILQRPRYEELLEEYKTSLLEAALIVYL